MNADRFCEEFESSGRIRREIDCVLAEWNVKRYKRTADDYLGFESFIALLVADASVGDGLLDQVSPELLAAFAARRGENLDSYDEVRSYLQQMLEHGNHSVDGVVSQIKGQLGELAFRDQAAGHAYLASSTNQEAWDVAIPHAHEATQYIQVKIYSSADAVIAKMAEVNKALAEKGITDGGNAVNHIDFAINEDLVAEVLRKQAQHPELADIKVYAIPVSNADATGVVVDGFNNVGPDELVHLFDEWFAGSISAACLHAMANAFLVYKGSKTIGAATEATVVSAALSAPGIAAAQIAAWLASNTKLALISGHPVIAAVAAGMLTRAIAKNWYDSRENTLTVLEREAVHNEILIRALAYQSSSPPLPGKA